jgi:hypothetical protein
MPSIRSLFGPGRRLLTRQLARLGDTLETFGTRLRDAVAAAVGETVSGIVRETVRAVLAEAPALATATERFVSSPQPTRPRWRGPDDPDPEPWYDDPEPEWPEADDQETPPAPGVDRTSARSRWPRALAVGFQTTLGWLRRSVGRFPVLTAVAVGLLTALATLAGGPLAAAAVGLAGSACNLLSLADAVQLGAATLAGFRRS